jgi:protease-4
LVRFFGYIWRFIERLVKAVQVIFFLFVIAFFFAVFSGMSGVAVSVPQKAALIIAPQGSLVEQASGETLSQALMSSNQTAAQTVVGDIVDSLRRAAEDDRIQAVVLAPNYLAGGGLSKQQVIAAAIDDFKASGKPVVAMADSYSQAQYYFASHADEIYMHDFGFVLIEGFGYFKTYFAEAIDKLKVDVNVFRVGEYKSFVEPYERNSMSEEDRDSARRWMDQLWSAYRSDIAAARGLTNEDFDMYVNNATVLLEAAQGDAAQAAKDAGLIDGLMNHQEFRSYMQSLVGVDEERTDSFANIDFQSYLMATDFENRESNQLGPDVAVIVASGNIVDGEAAPGTIGSLSLARLIREAATDDEVAALVLRVDSPGGSMFASEVVLDELEALQAAGKPFVASMSSVAASGGYYISMAADEIWAAETTISGSIGVGAIYPTFQRSLESLGVRVDGFGTTELAGQLNPTMKLGDQGRQLLDISVRSAYDVFIGKVAEHRGLELSRVDELARGRIWTGADARDLGLVDKLGTLDDALESAARLAGLPDDGWDTVYIARQQSLAEKLLMQYMQLLEQMLSVFGEGGSGLSSLMQGLSDRVGIAVPLLQQWNDPRSIYYHCLCEIS